MIWVAVIGFLLFLGVGGVSLWYWKMLKASGEDASSTPDSEQGELTAQEFLGIEDVRKNMIVLPGKRYRSVVAVQSINYDLLSEAEQQTVEIQYSSFLSRLNFPVQMIDQSRPLDTEIFVSRLQEHLKTVPPNLRSYMEETIQRMANWTANNPVLVRRKYVVVPYDAPQDMPEEDAVLELDRRTASVIHGLESVGLGHRVLTTEEILEVIYMLFHKPNATLMKFSHAITGGWNAWEVRGDAVAVADLTTTAAAERYEIPQTGNSNVGWGNSESFGFDRTGWGVSS